MAGKIIRKWSIKKCRESNVIDILEKTSSITDHGMRVFCVNSRDCYYGINVSREIRKYQN